MNVDVYREAVKTGHNSSSILSDVLREIADSYYCLGAVGFEGNDTYPDCGNCIYCFAKKLQEEGELPLMR